MDSDGFYYGAIGRRYGFVPSNMVYEIAKDEVVPERRRSEVYPLGSAATANHLLNRRARWGSLKSRSYDNPADHHSHRSSTAPRQRYSSTAAVTGTSRHPLKIFENNGHMCGDSLGGAEYGSPVLDPSTSRRDRSMPPPSTGRFYNNAASYDSTKSGTFALPLSARNAGSSGQLPRTQQHYYNEYPNTSYDYPPAATGAQRRLSSERSADPYDSGRDTERPSKQRQESVDYYPSSQQAILREREYVRRGLDASSNALSSSEYGIGEKYRGAVSDQYDYTPSNLPPRIDLRDEYQTNRYNDYNNDIQQQQRGLRQPHSQGNIGRAGASQDKTYQNEDSHQAPQFNRMPQTHQYSSPQTQYGQNDHQLR